MRRYFLKFSYIGTGFRGLEKQLGEVFNQECPHRNSIEAVLERGLERFRPVNTLDICFSSRTDKGVHALSNIAHVDLQHFREGSEFEPSCLLRGLNNFLKKTQTSLVISQVERVPDTFNARHEALSRHYMYRLGITSKSDFLPTAEWDRCHFIREPFCIDTANEVSLQLQGTHDYASFCHGLSQKPEGYPTVRTINTIQITEGRPLLDPKLDPFYSGIRFYDIHVTSRSFMYRQVRRMVAVLIAAGQKRMNAAEVQQLFDKPGTWNSKASVAPAHGLYLVNVEHKPIIKPVPTLNETQP